VNPDELAELEEQRTFLLRSLDDLDRELAVGDIDGVDASTLRDDYTHRLGEVQRAIESGHAALARGAAPRRTGRRLAVIGVVAVLALGAGFAVANAAGSRRPGDSVTGNIRENSANQLSRAAALQDEGKYLDAVKTYHGILSRDPRNAEANAELGFLLIQLSQSASDAAFLADGRRFVEKAIAAEPHNARWFVYRAMGLHFAGDEPGAQRAIDEALANNPSPELKATIESIRATLSPAP
jgi:tetratricopeptide (TPR) repeat protein